MNIESKGTEDAASKVHWRTSVAQSSLSPQGIHTCTIWICGEERNKRNAIRGTLGYSKHCRYIQQVRCQSLDCMLPTKCWQQVAYPPKACYPPECNNCTFHYLPVVFFLLVCGAVTLAHSTCKRSAMPAIVACAYFALFVLDPLCGVHHPLSYKCYASWP